jgi:Phosphatidylethanolamine-binding protein
MHLPSTSILATAALFLTPILAQVPASLSKAFNTQMQVNFKGDSALGFSDGDTIPFADTANQPVFALGDASGVNTAISFVVMMIDTTDPNNFIMHYLQTDFKATGEKTGLAATSTPLIPYAKPGSFGETGARQYTFLLYLERSSDIKSMPQAGGKFDYEAFNQANRLQPPTAGVAMKVNVGESPEAGAAAAGSSSSSSSFPSPTSAPPSSSSSAPTLISSSAPVTPAPNPSETDASIRTLTATSVTSEATPSSSGLTIQKTPPQPPFGGVVSEKPFPADVAKALMNVTLMSTSMTSKTNSSGVSPDASAAAAQAAVTNGVEAVVVRCGVPMAALVVMVAVMAFV